MGNEISLAQEALRHRLSDLSGKIKPHVREGFHLLSRVPEPRRHSFLKYLLGITEKGETLDREKAISLIGLDGNTISDVLSAVAMVIGATIDLEVTPEDFYKFGINDVFHEEDSLAAKEVAEWVISRRPALKSGMKDSALANSILPSFQSISMEIDVRLRFEDEEDRPSGGVPLAVCNLKTDCTDDVWFQMTRNDIEELAKKLALISRQMQAAEAISSRIE